MKVLGYIKAHLSLLTILNPYSRNPSFTSSLVTINCIYPPTYPPKAFRASLIFFIVSSLPSKLSLRILVSLLVLATSLIVHSHSIQRHHGNRPRAQRYV